MFILVAYLIICTNKEQNKYFMKEVATFNKQNSQGCHPIKGGVTPHYRYIPLR